jgi:putative FmdB family regulatory protein
VTYQFLCQDCGHSFEAVSSWQDDFCVCPKCNGTAKKQFNASNIFTYIPSWWHTNKSDIFSDTEWAELKKDPNAERAK